MEEYRARLYHKYNIMKGCLQRGKIPIKGWYFSKVQNNAINSWQKNNAAFAFAAQKISHF